MRDEHLATAGNTWITADEETQSQPSATADVTEAPGPGPFLPPAPGGAGWLSAATTQVIRRDRRGLRASGRGLRASEAGPAGPRGGAWGPGGGACGHSRDGVDHVQAHLHAAVRVVGLGLGEAGHAVVAVPQDLDAAAVVLLRATGRC